MNSAPTSIQDLTAGGGNETSRPGTVTNTADPSGFSFDLGTALGQQSWSYTMEQAAAGWSAADDVVWTIEAAPPVWRISQC